MFADSERVGVIAAIAFASDALQASEDTALNIANLVLKSKSGNPSPADSSTALHWPACRGRDVGG